MKLRYLLAGVSLGVAATLYVQKKLSQPFISSDNALKIVKDRLHSRGTVRDSWICTFTEEARLYEGDFSVYRGGVSVINDEHTHCYEFLVDAKTGDVLNIENVTEGCEEIAI